jgi:hypothetical protein
MKVRQKGKEISHEDYGKLPNEISPKKKFLCINVLPNLLFQHNLNTKKQIPLKMKFGLG